MALARSRGSSSPVIAAGSAKTSCGRTRCGAEWPSGSLWIAVISAPESVVGSAATRPPRTAAIAFAVSITRPPPSATSAGESTSFSSVAEISLTAPGGTSCTTAAWPGRCSGAPFRARVVVSSS